MSICENTQPFKYRIKRGDRPMHHTTLSLASEPCFTDKATTSYQQMINGSRAPLTHEKCNIYPSQHRSQIKFSNGTETNSTTTYQNNFYEKGVDVYYKIYYPTFVNKMNMNQGREMKHVLRPADARLGYWSQYNRIHGRLGISLLGSPSVLPHPTSKSHYNVLTGEIINCPQTVDSYRRTSGNRTLYNQYRRHVDNKFELG